MADVVFNSGKKDILSGAINLTSDTIKGALVSSSYTPDQDAHTKFSDITNEVSGTAYVAGGATLASKTFSQDNTNNRGVFDADDLQWAASTITNARGLVIYKDTGTASTSPLIGYLDFGADKSSSATTFRVQFNASGIFYIG